MNSGKYVQFGNNSLKILIYINSEKHIELGNKNSNIYKFCKNLQFWLI